MEVSIDLHNIEKGLQELFKFAFSTNCTLDEESVTDEEAKTLEELDASEVLENLKDLVLGLLKFKQDFKESEKGELGYRCEQFESLLQKSEAEVRNHIRVEHQLKLHIESHQNRIEELEKAEVCDKGLIKELEEKISLKVLGKQTEFEKMKKELEDRVKGLSEAVEKKERTVVKLEYENVKLRTLLEEKVRECENAKKEVTRISKYKPNTMLVSGSIDQLKRKLDLNKIQRNLKATQGVSENFRSDRKSMGETELTKLSVSPYMKRDYIATIKKEDSKSLTKYPSRGHIRSISDQKTLTSKRTPSR